MQKKQRFKQSGYIAIFSLSLLLMAESPNFAAEKQVDTFKLDSIIFRLTPLEPRSDDDIPLFRLANAVVDLPVYSQAFMEVPKESHRTENALFTASLLTLTALNIADTISTIKALQLC